MKKIKVLFVCIHNSARSQMAEALLKHHGNKLFLVDSAGLKPGSLNSFAVKAMAKMDIDISQKSTNNVFSYLKNGRSYHYVITVCDQAQSDKCPIFPGNSFRLYWSFSDPSAISGSETEKLEKTIEIRNDIEIKIKEFIKDIQKLIKKNYEIT